MMQKFIVATLIALGSIGNCAAVSVGDAAPNFELPQADQQLLELSKFKGKIVWLDFWASWCGPCRASFPVLDNLHKKYAEQGLLVVGINVDEDRQDALDFLQQTPVSFPIAYDPAGKAPTLYGVRAMPSSYLIDRHGKVHALHLGFKNKDAPEIEVQIKKLLEEPAL